MDLAAPQAHDERGCHALRLRQRCRYGQFLAFGQACPDDAAGYMIGRSMNGHALLGHLAVCSGLIGDGGPRRYRSRGKPLPEKYLPGRFLSGLMPDVRASVVEAANAKTSPALWFLRLVVGEDEEPRVSLPPPPVDRRWSCRGRWSTSTTAFPRRSTVK